MSTHNRMALWIILISSTLTVAAGVILAPVLNMIREGLQVNPASAGLIILVHAPFVALFSPLFGSLIDKMGPRILFCAGMFIYGLAGGAGLFVSSYWLLLVSRAVLGIGIAAASNSITVLIFALYKKERNKVMGWRGTASVAAGIVGPLIGGFLGGFSWHLPFAVYLLGIPLALAAFFVIPQSYTRNDTGKDSIFKVLGQNSVLFLIYTMFFLAVVLSYVIVVFLPQLLERMNISDPFFISLFIVAMAFSSAVVSFMYGKIRSRATYKVIVLTAFALWAAAFSVLSQNVSHWIAAASVVLVGAAYGVLAPAVTVWAGEIVAPSFRGRIISFLTTFGYIGQFSSLVIFGPVVLWLGLNAVFWVSGGICAVFFVLILIFLSDQSSQ